MSSVGERIRELRLSLDMSVDEFASAIGVHRSSIYRYEDTNRDLPISIAIKIAEKFNISLDWLAGVSDVRERNTAPKNQINSILDTLSPQGQTEVIKYASYVKSNEEGKDG